VKIDLYLLMIIKAVIITRMNESVSEYSVLLSIDKNKITCVQASMHFLTLELNGSIGK